MKAGGKNKQTNKRQQKKNDLLSRHFEGEIAKLAHCGSLDASQSIVAGTSF